jgi:neutral ceramidase
MSMKFSAGFAAIDITPEPGGKKIGWMADITIESILNPIAARAAVFEAENDSVGLISLDLLAVRSADVDRIRRGIEARYGFHGNSVLICATHNHASPASIRLTPVELDEAYVHFLVDRCVEVFGMALNNRQPAVLRRGSAMEFDVAYNRRTVMRDGTVRTQTSYRKNPDALYQEGPSDSELGAWLISNLDGQPLGAMVHFTCHPTDHGGDGVISDGFPGALCRRIEVEHAPVCLFLNGAYGNIVNCDFQRGSRLSIDETVSKLYAAFCRALESAGLVENPEIRCESRVVGLPIRRITDDEFHGRVRGVQRFRDDALYESEIALIRERSLRSGGKESVELQVLRLGDTLLAGLPAEYFVEYQLQLKTEAWPLRLFIVGTANGFIGYVPSREAFSRGGYEATMGPPSWMAQETGDLIADELRKMIH